MQLFKNSLHHLFAEIERIDLMIAAQVARSRETFAGDEQFRGLYIPEEEVDSLLASPMGRPRWAMGPERLEQVTERLERLRRRIDLRCDESARMGIEMRLHSLAQIFTLDPFDIDALLVALAVELDLRYERLYAYLQDDVTKKRPSLELILNLLLPSTEAKIERRSRFESASPLIRQHICELLDDPSHPHPPFLAKHLKVNNRIVQFLLGSDAPDERVHTIVEVIKPELKNGKNQVNEEQTKGICQFIQNSGNTGPPVIHLFGPYGVGKLTTAQEACRELKKNLLVAHLDRISTSDDGSHETVFDLIRREAHLNCAAVYWNGIDSLLDEQNKRVLKIFMRSLAETPFLTFLAGEFPCEPRSDLHGPFVSVELFRPSSAERFKIWTTMLDEFATDLNQDIAALSAKFKFTHGQIRDATATAANLARMRDSNRQQITTRDLYEACRLHSNRKLTMLAHKIIPKYQWNDIVLPSDRLKQLREICNHVRYRDRVYGEWGFDHKLSLGKGLCILFAGPSGTGKTMAAEIIAGELGLEVFKIDLSTVVSKYIGETEKNLSRIFSEAETSNAILFFDEADALFGRRSEVKDSHDRYANIETGYLLQRMEEYEGVVILATNFRKNMDDAFMRRLHFAVEFPFPDEADRRRIWEGIWPVDTPRESDLDLDFMAGHFEISGGNIRNIALAAAFFAADDSGIVTTGHLLRATQREYQKMGKVIVHGDFKGSCL